MFTRNIYGDFRNFIDHTSDFGGTQEQKTSKRIYPLLTGKSGGKIQSLILDGEMMVFDPMTDRFSPFGTIRTVAGSDTGEITNNPRPCCKSFIDRVVSSFISRLDVIHSRRV